MLSSLGLSFPSCGNRTPVSQNYENLRRKAGERLRASRSTLINIVTASVVIN